MVYDILFCLFFFFQAEDGIRDAQESRGLGDVYKRQAYYFIHFLIILPVLGQKEKTLEVPLSLTDPVLGLSLIHI